MRKTKPEINVNWLNEALKLKHEINHLYKYREDFIQVGYLETDLNDLLDAEAGNLTRDFYILDGIRINSINEIVKKGLRNIVEDVFKELGES